MQVQLRFGFDTARAAPQPDSSETQVHHLPGLPGHKRRWRQLKAETRPDRQYREHETEVGQVFQVQLQEQQASDKCS